MNRTLPPEIKDIEHFNLLPPVRTVLPNGIPLTIINAGEQEVVRIDLLFAGGRWQQHHQLQALFTNRMLREGTRKYSATSIAEKLDYYGAWLELSSSAEYAYITLYSLNKYIGETVEIIESIVKEPAFPEKELTTVVDSNIQQYLVNLQKVDFLAHRNLLSSLYGSGHPCGQLVEETDYRNLNVAMLREFYEEYYHSGNCSIFLSGKVTGEVLRRIESAFGTASFGNIEKKWASKDYPFLTVPEKRTFIQRPDALQSAVKLGAITLTRHHPDYLKVRVMMTLFGGYFGSRLMSNIREDKGYTYGISAGILFYPGSGALMISTEADNEYVDPLIKQVYYEIDRLHHDPVPEGELTTVRNYMLGEMCRNYESPFSLSDAWMFIRTSGLDDAYFTRSLQALKEVTSQELRELAQRYLCKETLKEVVAGKKMP
ncbi:MAG: pitrilysin family protein [Bacteroides sp.]